MVLQYSFCKCFIKFLKSVSDEFFNAIYIGLVLLETFIIKMDVVFVLTPFGTFKYNGVIKAMEILSFLPLINNSVTA